jgi:hypothetical protein
MLTNKKGSFGCEECSNLKDDCCGDLGRFMGQFPGHRLSIVLD